MVDNGGAEQGRSAEQKYFSASKFLWRFWPRNIYEDSPSLAGSEGRLSPGQGHFSPHSTDIQGAPSLTITLLPGGSPSIVLLSFCYHSYHSAIQNTECIVN